MNARFLSLLLTLAAGLSWQGARAQATAPSQGGEVSPVRITATTMELSFGTLGNGQGRMVAIAITPNGMPVPLAAANGTFYPANAVFGQGSTLGQGFVVYNGPDHSVTVTGLQPNTRYYLTNAEYNADGASIAYNTHSSSTSVSTAAAPIAHIPQPAPLPVGLTAFAGTVDARGAAVLRWATATEHNSDYFALERSADGAAFAEAGRVAAAGSSAQPLAYQWPDPQRLTQPTYYRLRQADRDGAVHYSAVVALAPPSSSVARQIDIYPNPSAGRPVQLSLQGFASETLRLQLADAVGRPVLAQTLTPAAAHYLAPLPLPAGLAAGTYVLTLAGSGSSVRKRLIVSD